MTDPTYALGRSDDEHAWLTEQANFLRPLTERLFKKAGITPGMKVLDVGSGVGDVAFLVAELVGPDGKVVGVDMDGAALEKARKRAEQLRLRNVEFVHWDIRTTGLPGPFDAAVGRLVLPRVEIARCSAMVSAVDAIVEELCAGALDDEAWKRAILKIIDSVSGSGAVLMAFNPAILLRSVESLATRK